MKGTIKEKAGYQFTWGSGGKKWKRGRIQYSEGRKYIGNHEYIECIVRTNLDTGNMEIASLAETKRFLTPEAYQEYLLNNFKRLAENA